MGLAADNPKVFTFMVHLLTIHLDDLADLEFLLLITILQHHPFMGMVLPILIFLLHGIQAILPLFLQPLIFL
jgi:hypothetical protein